jgi:hypothetical protein
MALKIELNADELDLLIEALGSRAARHESMARFNPRGAKPHELVARDMFALKRRLLGLHERV